jgi:drug/metabolite transporter (DMT)-like permease
MGRPRASCSITDPPTPHCSVCYGHNFVPPQYVVDHPEDFPGAPTDLKDYVFPHFCGIFITSLAFLVIYVVRKTSSGKQPEIYPEATAPAVLSGLVWACAQISWFFANQYLQVVVAFPLISIGPGLIGALWGVFIFKEITGRRNLIFLSTAFAIVGVATALIVVSK